MSCMIQINDDPLALTPIEPVLKNVIESCKCGGTAEFVKLWESKRYGGFVVCRKCGCENKAYTSKQNAVKAWNKMQK